MYYNLIIHKIYTKTLEFVIQNPEQMKRTHATIHIFSERFHATIHIGLSKLSNRSNSLVIIVSYLIVLLELLVAL